MRAEHVAVARFSNTGEAFFIQGDGVDKQPYPILEYDDTREALIAYDYGIAPEDKTAPERGVLCYFREVVEDVCDRYSASNIYTMRGETDTRSIYRIEVAGQALAVVVPPVGAPVAAITLERMIALGTRKFIACGGAGTLIPNTTVGHLVVPTNAVRDEGTSYHYLPPSREVSPDPAAVAAIEAALKADGADYITGKTWTTDAVFRETPAKIARRREEGCITVEMEAATFFAVAQFRGVTFGQILYCGDDVSGEEWDSRHWDKQASVREKLFWLAVEAALRL